MKILGIETSCDETAFSLIEATGDISLPKFKIIATALYSQIETHKPYGGVYPMLAKREHTKNIIPLFNSLLEQAGAKENMPLTARLFGKNPNKIDEETTAKLKEIFKHETDLAENFIKYFSKIKKPDQNGPNKIDMIAVTNGPGLEPALWVGINFARALSLIWQIPVIPVNHMEGHILSVLHNAKFETEIKFPAIALLISGGHTEIILVKQFGEYEIIGETRDDAVGEAFDKVARILNLPYPGGPEISKLAELSQTRQKTSGENLSSKISLPRPMLKSNDFDFSFSGLKTAVLYLVKELKEKNLYNDEIRQDIAHEFQNASIEVLYTKVRKSIEKFGAESLIIGGGVIANTKIRETFKELEKNYPNGKESFKVYIPEMNLTTDNAVMIAFAGYISQFKARAEINPEIRALGNLRL